MRILMREALPQCEICHQSIEGHLFKHLACTPIARGNVERMEALLAAVDSADWNAIQAFQHWDGTKISADVIALKCEDGRCSLAVLYCPASMGDIYKLIRQKKLDDLTSPMTQDFSGTVLAKSLASAMT